MKSVQAEKIHIGRIHNVKRPRLDHQQVQGVDIVAEPISDLDERGNRPAQVQEGMQFDRRFGGDKACPRKEVQQRLMVVESNA